VAAQPPSDAELQRRPRLVIAAVAGLFVLTLFGSLVCGDDGGKAVARDYAKQWSAQNFVGMYKLLSDDSKKRVSLDQFSQAQRQALATATVRRLMAHEPKDFKDGSVTVPFTVETRAFGTLKLDADIPLTDDATDAKVKWSDSLALPGLRTGEQLSRQTSLAPRASIFASDGQALAEGPDRTSPIPDVAKEIAGSVGTPDGGIGLTLQAYGYPQDAKVGVSGLEKVFQQQLAGTPGGTLLAGSRTLASTRPRAGRNVNSTIVPSIELAASAALAGRAGGAAAVDPRTGAVLAAAGSAFSETAPPGSTFKIITAAAALESKAATLKSTYPYETQALLDGRPLQNANGETCGGTLVQSFANSCNSVFAPLGVKVGSGRLVEMAEKLGFNKQFPNIPNAAVSTIPPSDQIQGEDATGTTAIGQGEVMASTLAMTMIAAAVGNKGVWIQPTLQKGSRPKTSRAMSLDTALGLKKMMLAVVRYGTGTSAAITGGSVAGKTGTAEIRDTVAADPNDPNAPSGNDPANTDAWFVAFAPSWAPRVAVGVLLVGQGHGGDTAAPAARDVFVEALRKNR